MIWSSKDFVDLINVIVWPIIVLIVLWVLRKPLSKFISELGGRATKVSVFQVSLEFTAASEATLPWQANNIDFRQLTPSYVFDSQSISLFQAIANMNPSDYSIVDLGVEKQWLTSRLYLFALLLGHMRSLKCFVFLETRGSIPRYFLGTATPYAILWTLRQKYPEYENAFLEAYDKLQPGIAGTAKYLPILSDPWALDHKTASDFAQNFISEIQRGTPPLPFEEKDWIAVDPQQQLWERAAWLDGQQRSDILSALLQKASVEENLDATVNEQVQAILRRSGEFVALVDKQGSFLRLIDRQNLLEKVADKYAEPV